MKKRHGENKAKCIFDLLHSSYVQMVWYGQAVAKSDKCSTPVQYLHKHSTLGQYPRLKKRIIVYWKILRKNSWNVKEHLLNSSFFWRHHTHPIRQKLPRILESDITTRDWNSGDLWYGSFGATNIHNCFTCLSNNGNQPQQLVKEFALDVSSAKTASQGVSLLFYVPCLEVLKSFVGMLLSTVQKSD